MRIRSSVLVGVLGFVPVGSGACGGASAASPPSATPSSSQVGSNVSEAEVAQAQKPCGDSDRVHTHDLSAGSGSETFAPCAKSGARDYSALVHLETLDEGVRIVIDATDDEVTLLGPEVKERDAVMVYPKGKGTAGVEVPLMKTANGYRGDKVVLWNDMGKLNDEGTKIDLAIYDHDASAHSTEEMHVALAVSTGKSCEKARDENMETLNLADNGAAGRGAKAADLTADQLGAPMRSSAFFATCGLSDSANADVCVAVKKGRPVGVSVTVNPGDNRVAACIDRSARRLHFPASESLDVVHQKF